MMSHYIEEVHAIKIMHDNYLDSLHIALNHHPTPKAKPSGFGEVPRVKNSSPIHILHWKTA